MKIGISQLVWKGSLDSAFELCRAAGYEVLELNFTEGGDPDINLSDDGLREIKAKAAAAGVGISSILGRYKDRGGFLTTDAELRSMAARSLARAIDIAAVLDAGAVLLHPGQMDASASYLEVFDIFVKEMKQIAGRAESKGVVVCIENVWNKFMLSPKEAVDLIDAIDSPAVKIYLDTANMMAYGFPEQWIRDLGQRIYRVHLKDFKRREHKFVSLMEGDTPWSEVMGALRQVGYDSYLVHEVSGEWDEQVALAERMRQIVKM
ncbi:MAG TPA: sugar phosphate isomerase/epimerase [Firmicutes bacterium]|nr:sugar phosphate isomerase/epimerase [Bacillota bacterium]